MGVPEDKISLSVEELPYFEEKYFGKICCFCNLSERSSLGQGDIIQIETTPSKLEEAFKFENNADVVLDTDFSLDDTPHTAYRRSKLNNKSKQLQSNECVNELEKIGHPELITLSSLLDENYIYVHRKCAMWTIGIELCNNDVQNMEMVVARCLRSRCSFCGMFGASISCRMDCTKNYHLPCSVAIGCLLISENLSAFCIDHLNQFQLFCGNINISCQQCSNIGDIFKLTMCSNCGDHYHTTCIGLVNQPDTKTGWCCDKCIKCQICRQSDSNDSRAVKCEHCQKLYHATCLRPTISSIPKYGWKCNRCRVCTDCGSRTPGAGTSSRWHGHYTICDSCYQQRNKGFSCPICHRAYRASAHKEMVKCSLCNRFVHSSCDTDADLLTYHKRKENNPDYDYVCPHCKSSNSIEKVGSLNNQMRSFSDSDASSIGFISNSDYKDMEIEYSDRGIDDISALDDNQKYFKKRVGLKDISRRGGKMFFSKSHLLTQFGRKRARGKTRHMLMYGGNAMIVSENDRTINRSNDEDMCADKKLLLCSAKDKFILSQDLCVMCGSVGNDLEDCLLTCSQCGQCYHPYCVNIKISKIMLEKGWRCLDCTVCEGCGQKNDESRLLLCDECDISYHIYCMNPPLETVPHGNWKCNWCAICQKCGKNSTGKNSVWRNGFLECGPCASETQCSICLLPYSDNDLIIQCQNCDRWLHCVCDSIKSEEEAQFCDSIEYHCRLCRPKDKSLSYLIASKTLNKGEFVLKNNAQNLSTTCNKINSLTERPISGNAGESADNVESYHWIDGVCVSDRGLNVIKNLTTEVKKKRKMRTSNDGSQQKDLGILATIESVVAGTQGENLDGDLQSKHKDEFKDGMIWHGQISSPPPGFAVTTNDDGINILRKKRQRNLQKLGIGGFVVRNRAVKKDNDDKGVNPIETTSSVDSDKKRKIMRKKMKSKLTEVYPAYLQEAFFGKELLVCKDSTNKLSYESDSSDQSQDFLKYKTIENYEIKPKNSETQVREQEYKITPTGEALENATLDKKPMSNMLSLNSDFLMDCKQRVFKNPVYHTVTSSTTALTHGVDMQNNEKPILSTIPNIVHMATSSADIHLPCTSENIKAVRKDHSSSFVFNKDGNKFNKSVLGSSGNLLHESVNPPESNGAHQQIKIKEECPYLDTSNSVQKINLFLQKSQTPKLEDQSVLSVQSDLQMLTPIENNYQNLQTMQIPQNFKSNKNESQIQLMQLQENSFSVTQELIKNKDNQNAYEPVKTEEPVEVTVAGTQKTAEKMRRDEELGNMATISAVLYSNTQHPELKQSYPNWTDRCKQILKRWRSLSTEKKAPFLQLAKDNRSALRTRKTQQDQEKSCAQQKSLKEQEQERLWKLHQAKIKEPPNPGLMNDALDVLAQPENARPLNNMYITKDLDVSKKKLQTNKKSTGMIITTPMCTTNAMRLNNNVEINILNSNGLVPEDGNEQIKPYCSQSDPNKGDKKLRNLLQKPSEMPWMTPNVEKVAPLFKPSDHVPSNDIKSKIIVESSKGKTFTGVSSNIMKLQNSINFQSDVLGTSEQAIKQSIATEKQDAKNRNVFKISEQPEGVSVVEFEKLDQDAENAGFNDILGGFGEGDDDDLLKSLTAEIGDDFNILEYADPELDTLTNNQNLLNKLDFDEGGNNN